MFSVTVNPHTGAIWALTPKQRHWSHSDDCSVFSAATGNACRWLLCTDTFCLTSPPEKFMWSRMMYFGSLLHVFPPAVSLTHIQSQDGFGG